MNATPIAPSSTSATGVRKSQFARVVGFKTLK
jgi:hypothetical protein